MKFTLEVGQRERHTIEFTFNQLFGTSSLKIDGAEVFRKKRWFSEPIVEQYEFAIDAGEQIFLRIEKQRKLLFASRYKIYVDNRLTQLYQGV